MKLQRLALFSLLGCLLAASLPVLAQAPSTAPAQSPSTLLAEVYTAHRIFDFKRWANQYSDHNNNEAPVSVQQMLKLLPAEDGSGWLWLVDRKQTADFGIQVDFVSGGWALTAQPLRSDSNLSLFLDSAPQAFLQGGDAGGNIGNSSLPRLDVRKMEKSLDEHLDGPGDLEALIRGLAIHDAQTVVRLKTGAYACTMEALDKFTAADHRLIDLEAPKSDGYFDYLVEGVKGSDGRCTSWVFRAKNRLEGFPTFEVGADRAVWVLPTWGIKKGLRFPFDQWKASRR